jgi:hypothetical protein
VEERAQIVLGHGKLKISETKAMKPRSKLVKP